MVHEVDDGCQELAHVRFDVVRAGEQFGNLVGEVGGDYLVEPSLFNAAMPSVNRPKVVQMKTRLAFISFN